MNKLAKALRKAVERTFSKQGPHHSSAAFIMDCEAEKEAWNKVSKLIDEYTKALKR